MAERKQVSRREFLALTAAVGVAAACNLSVVVEEQRKRDVEEEEAVRTGVFTEPRLEKRLEIIGRVVSRKVEESTGRKPKSDQVIFLEGDEFVERLRQAYLEVGYTPEDAKSLDGERVQENVPVMVETSGRVILNPGAGAFRDGKSGTSGLVDGNSELHMWTAYLVAKGYSGDGQSELIEVDKYTLGQDWPKMRPDMHMGLMTIGEAEGGRMVMYGLHEAVATHQSRLILDGMGVEMHSDTGEKLNLARLEPAGINAAVIGVAMLGERLGWTAADWAKKIAANDVRLWIDEMDQTLKERGVVAPLDFAPEGVGRALYSGFGQVVFGLLPPEVFVVGVNWLVPEMGEAPRPTPTPVPRHFWETPAPGVQPAGVYPRHIG